MEIINFGVVASKNAVSPFAPERGKARKRFKNAVEEVVNGGKGGAEIRYVPSSLSLKSLS